MEEEWHISDSEEEENMDNTSKLINTRLEKLSSLSQTTYSSSKTFVGQKYVPRNFIALYEQIENDGFINLQCQRLASKGKQVEIQNIPTVSTADLNINEIERNEDIIDNTTATQTQPSQSSDFDYKEELFETTVMFPKRSKKSGIDKYKKTKKRVGTMENVINDLSRFRALDADAMANQKQQ